MRKLFIIGEIDDKSYNEFTRELSILESESHEDIEIELNSGGGVAYDGLAFYSRMQSSPCNFIIRAYGLVASAASIILVGGDKRMMSAESWFMVHEDRAELDNEINALERELKHLRVMEDQWNKILAKHTKVTRQVWESLNKDTTYFSAQQCLKLGVIDKII